MDLGAINQPLKAEEEWATEHLCIECYDSPNSVVPDTVDLATWLPKDIDRYKQSGGGMMHDKRLWLPKIICDGASIADKFNKESCHKGGYCVVVASTKKKNKNATKADKIYIRCEHYRRAAKSVATKNKTHSTKSQNKSSKTCDWYIQAYLDRECDRYYIRQNGGHCLDHCGHAPSLQSRKEELETNVGTRRKRKTSTSTEALNAMANPNKQSAYARVHPNFVETMNIVSTNEDIEIVNECLHQARAAIMSRRVSPGNVSNSASSSYGGLLSYPYMETRKKVARQKPFGSPTKPRRK